MRVLAALSGGVDSAVAAARALDAGHDVTAVHLALSSNPQRFRSGARGCCSLEDSRDARRVADLLEIPYYVWDLAEQFKEDVVDNFVAEYSAGRTPNPCLRCNESIKFSAVLDRAVALGFDAVCTGHYARLVDGPQGHELHRSVDDDKDQSYVLAVLEPDQLARAMFPLGASHKSQVRAEAKQRGLLVADKPDSHDICFIPDGDTRGFLAAQLGKEKGPIVDVSGEVVGQHEGAYAFTVGQRRGLDLNVSAPDRSPRYVLSIEPVTNTVTVGPGSALEVDRIDGEQLKWCGSTPDGAFDCEVQVRAHGEAVTGRAELMDEQVVVRLQQPQHGVAPGQAVVLYEGTRVVGSATIVRAGLAIPSDV
ncbi:MAG TPA: tRNA 2-thiouridine(34) synthase MnmA [Actinomycetes bacterium]|nr:tRNA 2-thiouridine(34) synthase MnmA [Actinomycetes bacterium]